MTVEEINKKWGHAFIQELNKNQAPIVLALGLTKDGKFRLCWTGDLTKEQYIYYLQKLLDSIKRPEIPCPKESMKTPSGYFDHLPPHKI